MNRGPSSNAARNRDDRTMVEKARDAWGDLPDWISELAKMADAKGLNTVAKTVGYSAATLSTVLHNKYRGDVGRVEAKVRGALMAETVMCPVYSEIGRNRCLDIQKQKFAATNSTRVRVYRACRSVGNLCPHSRVNGDSKEFRHDDNA